MACAPATSPEDGFPRETRVYRIRTSSPWFLQRQGVELARYPVWGLFANRPYRKSVIVTT